MAKKTLNVLPFPPLKWDDSGWAGKITLPSWAGFKLRPDSPRSRKVSDGTARLSVEIDDPIELRSLMNLSNVHVLYVTKDATAYIGFELECVWKSEHGAGVMTHLGRIVEVGAADCSFLEWIAERDARRRKRK